MNESEKRWEQLLRETRKRYSDSQTPPAIHPRYRSAWKSIQPEAGEEAHGTFGIRLFAALLLFVLFVSASSQEIRIWNIPASEITDSIEAGIDFSQFPDLF